MSAAQLTLDSLSNAELDARAAAAVTSYGVGTHSYNHSGEKREMDRQRAVVTARYLSQSRTGIELPLTCTCSQRTYPHELSAHRRIYQFEAPGTYVVWNGGDDEKRIRFADEGMKWPWSLRYAPEMNA